MQRQIPSQCPECRSISIEVVSVSPDNHDRGEDWLTRVECEECGEYAEWFE